jgi:hypothetical protein
MVAAVSVNVRQHTSAHDSIRQPDISSVAAAVSVSGRGIGETNSRIHTSAYVSIRQPTSACVSIRQKRLLLFRRSLDHLRSISSCSARFNLRFTILTCIRQHASAYVSMRQHTSACVSIRQHASAYVSMRLHTYVSSFELRRVHGELLLISTPFSCTTAFSCFLFLSLSLSLSLSRSLALSLSLRPRAPRLSLPLSRTLARSLSLARSHFALVHHGFDFLDL